MAINRFYNPQRGQYISQFVPQQLPADLMLGIIQNKRAEANKQEAKGEQMADALLKIQAIKNSVDEAKLGEYRTNLRNNLNEFIGKVDLASAQGQREYREMLKQFSPLENKDLASIQGRYDYAKSIEEEREEMRKDPTKYGEGVFFKSYDISMEDFLKQKEFNKNYSFSSKEHITAGIDRYKYYEDFYNNLTANSSEGSSKIQDELGSAFYKISNEGISYKRIQGRTGEVLATAINSPAGTQTRREVLNELRIKADDYESLPKEAKEAIEQETAKRVTQGLMAAGKERIFSKTGSDKASALNKLEQRGYDYKKENAYDVITGVLGTSSSKMTAASIDDEIVNTKKEQYNAYKEYQRLLQEKANGVPISESEIQKAKAKSLELYKTLEDLETVKDSRWNTIVQESGAGERIKSAKKEKEILLNNLSSTQKDILEKWKSFEGQPSFQKAVFYGQKISDVKAVENYLNSANILNNKIKQEKNFIEHIWDKQYKEPIEDRNISVAQTTFSLDNNLSKSIVNGILTNQTGYKYYNPVKGTILKGLAGNIIEIKPLVQLTTENYRSSIGQEESRGYSVNIKVRTPAENPDGSYKKDSKGNIVYEDKNYPVVAVPGSGALELDYATISSNLKKQSNTSKDPKQKQFLASQATFLDNARFNTNVDRFIEETSQYTILDSRAGLPEGINIHIERADKEYQVKLFEGEDMVIYKDFSNPEEMKKYLNTIKTGL